jgi:hypothetical protein
MRRTALLGAQLQLPSTGEVGRFIDLASERGLDERALGHLAFGERQTGLVDHIGVDDGTDDHQVLSASSAGASACISRLAEDRGVRDLSQQGAFKKDAQRDAPCGGGLACTSCELWCDESADRHALAGAASRRARCRHIHIAISDRGGDAGPVGLPRRDWLKGSNDPNGPGERNPSDAASPVGMHAASAPVNIESANAGSQFDADTLARLALRSGGRASIGSAIHSRAFQ